MKVIYKNENKNADYLLLYSGGYGEEL